MKNHCLKTVCLIFFWFLGAQNVWGQFTFSGEIRPRTELRHGFKKLASPQQEVAFFTEQRTRLMMHYSTKQYEFRLSLQDVRIWGSVDQVFKEDPSLTGIHEAWGLYHFNKRLSIKMGRQELDYDNARILGNLAWAAQSRSHDLIKLSYATEDQSIHLGAAFNQDANTPEFAKLASTYYTGVNNYKTMQYLWYHHDFDKAKMSLLALNNGIQVGEDSLSNVNFSQTIGFVGSLIREKVTLGGEFYYQTGKDPVDRDIKAWLASLTASVKLGTIGLTLGADHLSGTDPGETKNRSFIPLYGTNHKFYGYMDYFFVGNPHGNVGLRDYFVKANFKAGPKSSLAAHLHYFFAGADITDPLDAGQMMSSGLGTEIDIVYNLNLSETVNFKLGYSQMFGTDTMEAIKGGKKDEFNNWAWAMMTFKPVFIKK